MRNRRTHIYPRLMFVSAKVMVISDPNATKAAAAMSVDVGAASDPADLPGLAHFLEHMLFLGECRGEGVLLEQVLPAWQG